MSAVLVPALNSASWGTNTRELQGSGGPEPELGCGQSNSPFFGIVQLAFISVSKYESL